MAIGVRAEWMHFCAVSAQYRRSSRKTWRAALMLPAFLFRDEASLVELEHSNGLGLKQRRGF
ncbi:MAG: hypothetical protein CMJ77_09115 [Planctomycetaceae bacterium]|nr:hypothetical protein [Planctomycetaceae bacterium]